MTIPTYDRLMLPLLQFAADGQEYHVREAIEALGRYLELTEEQRNELLPSGKKRKLDDRVQWAKTYLKKAGLIDSTGWGRFRITQRGLDVLNNNPGYINREFLMQFPEFEEFITPSPSQDTDEKTLLTTEETPTELLRSTYQNLRQELADELLDYVLSASPTFFEQLVVDLLLAMGYGSALEDAGHRIGRSGDGGIDGYIKQDKLGLDNIYIQAKRWARENTVGRPDLQNFVGSLIGAGAAKGVFIATSSFSQAATDYVNNLQNLKIILIDGYQLTQLMIDHDVGVSVEETYIVKRVDRDYFEMA
jgi:restriction system protein